MNARKTLCVVAIGLAAFAAVPLQAHEAAALRGGIVRTVSDLQYELVVKGSDASIFVDDHGKPSTTAGMSGKLTVLMGKETTEAELRPAGDNRLEAKGLKLGSGARIVAVIRRDATKTVTVRYTLK